MTDKSKISFVLRKINISEINLNDRSLCFRFFTEPSRALRDSIKRFGIIYPPLLLACGNTYQILDGFQRIDAASICDMESICCKVSSGFFDELEKISFALSIFLSPGPPHLLDQSTIIKRLNSCIDEDIIINNILPLLGYPPSKKVLDRLVPLSELGERLGKALLDGKISQEMALHLMRLSKKEREQIGSLFLYFGYSQSKQFEIIENLNNISMREGISLIDILIELGWDEAEKTEVKNKALAGEVLRKRLRSICYPTISNMEAVWRRKWKTLHLPPSISLTPPPFFESDAYKISFAFKNADEFREKIEELKVIGEKEEWNELFSKKI